MIKLLTNCYITVTILVLMFIEGAVFYEERLLTSITVVIFQLSHVSIQWPTTIVI